MGKVDFVPAGVSRSYEILQVSTRDDLIAKAYREQRAVRRARAKSLVGANEGQLTGI